MLRIWVSLQTMVAVSLILVLVVGASVSNGAVHSFALKLGYKTLHELSAVLG